MTPSHCERVWQAEAIEDGRLDGPERLSFEKHARTCSICAKELAALGDLRETMRRVPALTSTPLEHRRLRAELLRRANTRAVHRSGPFGQRWGWLAVVAACGTAALIVIVWAGRWSLSPRSAEVSPGPPVFEVEDAAGAEWTSAVVASEVRAHLTAGAASFHVEHTRPGQRFLLQMPDAQIEVHGTRFRVEVRRGTTRRVQVSEGIVTLRRRQEPERRLRAGETWDALTNAEDIVGSLLDPSTDEDASADTLGTNDAGALVARTETRSEARPSGARSDPFNAAVAAFRRGNYRKAEQLLDRFLEATPHDARVEDAWFMKTVARARTGDTQGAAQVARGYLERFPQGLRRIEAERIATGHPISGP
jgi:TolA-binding protein